MARDRSFWKRWEEVRRQDYENTDPDARYGNSSERREYNYLRKFATDDQIKRKENPSRYSTDEDDGE